MRWLYQPPPEEAIDILSREAGINPVIAELLLRNQIASPQDAKQFLNATLGGLNDPFLLQNLEEAAKRLRAAIARNERIMVLGDYDVDGVSSTALLVSVLRRFGLNPGYVVPRRMEDGYGLSRSAIDRALEGGKPDLFVALDCGTNSHDEVEYLISLGIDVLVVDHHRSKEKALERGLLVNPHVYPKDGDEPWRNLCTVGLVFKLAHGLLKLLRAEGDPEAMSVKLREYLDLVALGTIADLVPLRGENRILAKQGLRTLQTTQRCGVRALMRVAGVKLDQEVMPVDISFRLGPRINASGRLADAAISVDLLLSEDPDFCEATAQQLDAFNRERQDIERQITEQAEKMIESQFAHSPAVVLFGEEWHPGVVGIVAGRVTRKYNRPCVVLGNEGDLAKGSGRSIDGINLVDALGICAAQLRSWGGHPLAVGVALEKVRLEEFRLAFAQAVQTQAGGALLEARLELAAWLRPEDIRERLMEELTTLHPFGQGNPEPVFGVRGVVLRQRPEIFKATHFRFQFDDRRGRRLYGVAWKMAQRVPPVGVPLDLAVEMTWNYFNDRRLLQLELIDWRLSESPAQSP